MNARWFANSLGILLIAGNLLLFLSIPYLTTKGGFIGPERELLFKILLPVRLAIITVAFSHFVKNKKRIKGNKKKVGAKLSYNYVILSYTVLLIYLAYSFVLIISFAYYNPFDFDTLLTYLAIGEAVFGVLEGGVIKDTFETRSVSA